MIGESRRESDMTNSRTCTSEDDEPGQRLLREIAQMLVDESAAVAVDCLEENGVTTLSLRVAPGDIGKVIGKQGRTARSLRTILSASGMKFNRRYCLNIEEDYSDSESAGRHDVLHQSNQRSRECSIVRAKVRGPSPRPCAKPALPQCS